MPLKKIAALNQGDLFKVQMYCLRFIGVWPGPIMTAMKVHHVALATINCLFLGLCSISEIIYGYQHISDDLQLALDCLAPATAKGVQALKIAVLIIRRNELKELLNVLHDLCLKGEFLKNV
jgi:hypothetical protein